MPYDLDTRRAEPRPSLRAAVLDLIARKDADRLDDGEMRAALRALVAGARDPADDLWDRYRGGRPDSRGRVFARYGY